MSSIYKRLNFYYKINKISGKLLLPKSSDPFVSSTWVVVNTGNWFASNAIANTEPRLALKKIMGCLVLFIYLRFKPKTPIHIEKSF